MPDRRTHRGRHPEDARLFGQAAVERLRSAVEDFSLLLTKGYGEKGALKLVGDRFSLTARQRLAVLRNACSDEQLQVRSRHRVGLGELRAKAVAVDGYNVLITVEAAMSGGVIFRGRDGCYKDLASIHGTYRRVSETLPAVQLIGDFLVEIGVGEVVWLLDSPVSNSGRLKTFIAEVAEENGWRWDIRLLANPDAELIKSERIVASSDGVVLDRCGKWVNLAAEIIERKLASVSVIDLCPTGGK